jgi:hypothetical protein
VRNASNTSLISNVTPYWWHRHWSDRKRSRESETLIQRALSTLTRIGEHVDEVRVTGGGIEVCLNIGLDQDPLEVQAHADALRTSLDELVPVTAMACLN